MQHKYFVCFQRKFVIPRFWLILKMHLESCSWGTGSVEYWQFKSSCSRLTCRFQQCKSAMCIRANFFVTWLVTTGNRLFLDGCFLNNKSRYPLKTCRKLKHMYSRKSWSMIIVYELLILKTLLKMETLDFLIEETLFTAWLIADANSIISKPMLFFGIGLLHSNLP